jgi:hypothetical protein
LHCNNELCMYLLQTLRGIFFFIFNVYTVAGRRLFSFRVFQCVATDVSVRWKKIHPILLLYSQELMIEDGTDRNRRWQK